MPNARIFNFDSTTHLDLSILATTLTVTSGNKSRALGCVVGTVLLQHHQVTYHTAQEKSSTRSRRISIYYAECVNV